LSKKKEHQPLAPKLFAWRNNPKPHLSAIRIAFLYLIFGATWILTTDQLLELVFGNSSSNLFFQMVKGWVFVALTAIFIYALVIDTLDLYVKAQEKLKLANADLKVQLERTEASEQRYQLAVLGSSDSIWEYDAKNQTFFMDGRILRSLGYSEEESHISDMTQWLALVVKEDMDHLRHVLDEFTKSDGEVLEATYRIYRKDGEIAWIKSHGYSLKNARGHVSKVAGSHTDITMNKVYEDQLTRLAYYDTQSGLLNWQGFGNLVDSQIQTEPDRPFALLYMDIDDFKDINDVHGYTIGNKLLKYLADDLLKIVTPPDIVAKLGGDGFGVMTFTDDPTQLKTLARRLLECFQTERKIDDQILSVSASLGITTYPNDDRSFKNLMQSADEAMYEAKRTGKNKHYFYTAETHQHRVDMISLTKDLRKAVDNHELTLVFQPIYRFSDRKVCALECLVRWRHKERGEIPPSVFIPIAENAGWINLVETAVFTQAFRQIQAWKAKGLPLVPIAINLSAHGVADDAFIHTIQSLRDAYGIKQGEFEIEVTESSLIRNYDAAIRNLRRLRETGVKILLDDFGQGYSSLTYLVNLPIDILKIDREFIRGIGTSDNNDAIVKTIVGLAHDMHLLVVAEGIETQEQALFLNEAGTDYAQGYLYHRPANSEIIGSLIQNI